MILAISYFVNRSLPHRCHSAATEIADLVLVGFNSEQSMMRRRALSALKAAGYNTGRFREF
jgi:hypothetical protein